MNHFKTLQATALAIALLASSTARATGYEYSAETPCDLRTVPVVMNRTNVMEAYRLNGRFDSTQRKWWVDVIGGIAWATLIGGMVMMPAWWEKDYDTKHLDHDGDLEKEEAFRDLRLACRQFIRKNYRSDILYDNGPNLIAANYFCGEPMVNGVVNGAPSDNNGDGNQYAISIMYGEAVLENLTTEQVTEKKCASLEACYRKSDGRDFDWIADRMKKLGCM